MTDEELNAIEARCNAVPICLLFAEHRENGGVPRGTVNMDDSGDVRFVADVNERWGPYADLFAHARTDIPALVAEVRELRLILANERGEGEGPSEGWRTDGLHWRADRRSVLREIGSNDGMPFARWSWAWFPGGAFDVASGRAPTAREAMRAADLARAGGAT